VSIFRSLWRSVQLVGMFAAAGTELAVKRPKTREARADWLHRFAARAVRRMGIEIDVAGAFPERGAVISNHLGYLDIVTFAALHPCVFVAKAEMESWPVVGLMTTMSGTVYVARGHGGSAVRARKGMQSALNAGLPVVFFPEGTTSDGSSVLKFHSGLLAQAMACGAPVTAAYVKYSLGAGNGADVSVARDMSCTLIHSSGPWMFCMPVNRLGVGTPSSVKREPSVPPRVGVDDGSMPSRRLASRARSTGRMSFSSQ